MRMDDSIPSSHSLPCAPPLTLHILDPRVREVNLIRQHAADSGHHLALQLGVEGKCIIGTTAFWQILLMSPCT